MYIKHIKIDKQAYVIKQKGTMTTNVYEKKIYRKLNEDNNKAVF